MHEQPPWLARVRNSRGGTAGTGVAVDGEHVITCAHLAEPGSGGGAALLLEPGREVVLEFPFLGRTATATVVEGGWFPEMPDGTGDFAVLRMAEPPQGLSPAPLRRTPGPPGTAVELRGFPDDSALARTARGRLSHPPSPQWMQIDPDGDGWSVAKGFSGGPVWDVGQKAVVGLTVAKDANRVGHMLTMRYLCDLWPPLIERLTPTPPAAEKDLSRWWPPARGLSGAHEQGWLFRGRRKALTEIADWLRDGRRHRVLVVTGTPGVGKSATLGRIVTTSYKPWAAMLPEEDTAVRAEPGSVDCAVHAKGKKATEVANEILAKCGGESVKRPEDFAGAMARALAAGDRFSLVLDALDEAEDAKEARLIASRILRPLSELPRTSVVAGSRRVDGSGDLLAHFGNSLRQLDLDSPKYFEPQDLTDYARAALQQASGEAPENPYGDPAVAAAVAKRIAELAEGNFLAAGLVARGRGRHDEEPIAPAELSFDPDVSVVFWEYLDRLEPFDGVPAEDLLTALAFADAPGFTAELWAAALHSLEGITVNPRRLVKFAKSGAANYLIETGASDGRSFRIFHQALVDACLRKRAETEDRSESEALLAKGFIGIGRTSGWEQAPPYLWRSLIGHAARGEAVEALLEELDYLVVADPERLLPVLATTTTGESALRASIYRASSGHLPTAAPHERRALLAYNAARFGANRLAAALAAPPEGRALEWRPLWATGSGIDSRLQLTIPDSPSGTDAIACAVLDGVPVVALGVGDKVDVWNLVTGSLMTEIQTNAGSWVTALACGTMDGTAVVVIGNDDGTIEVADLTAGRVLTRADTHGDAAVTCLEWAVVGGHEVAVSGHDDGDVLFTELRTGGRYGGMDPGHLRGVNGIACAEVGGRPVAVSGGEDGTVRIWDLASGRQQSELRQHSSSSLPDIDSLDCTVLEGRPIAITGGSSGLLRLWDLEHLLPLGAPFGDVGQMISALTCLDLAGVPVVVTADYEGMIRVWDLTSRQEQGVGFKVPQPRRLRSLACTVLGDRHIAITAGSGDLVHLWELFDHQQHGERSAGHETPVASIATASVPGNPLALSTSAHEGITIRDVATGATLRTIFSERHSFGVKDMACESADGEWIVVGIQHSDVVRIWKVATGEQQRPILTDMEWPQAVACALIDGRVVAVTGGEDGRLRLQDIETGDMLKTIDTGDERSIAGMDSLTVDGDPHAVTLHYGNTLRSWNLRTGDPLHQYRIETTIWLPSGIACVDVEGELLAAVTHRNAVTVLDLATGAVTAVIPFPEAVQATAFTEDGRLVVGSGRDVSVFARKPRSSSVAL